MVGGTLVGLGYYWVIPLLMLKDGNEKKHKLMLSWSQNSLESHCGGIEKSNFLSELIMNISAHNVGILQILSLKIVCTVDLQKQKRDWVNHRVHRDGEDHAARDAGVRGIDVQK